MAQAELRPPSSMNGCTRVRIKLKLPGAKKAPVAVPGGSNSSTGTVLQLAELHAAVEAFCQQGLHSLPGGVLLSPWREPSPEEPLQQQQQQQHEQDTGVLPGVQQQHDQPARKRVRKRRVPDAEDAAAGGLDGEQLLWGAVKRPRSTHHRTGRDATQLSNSIHSMMQPASVVTSAPASPSVVSQAPSAATAAAAAPAAPAARSSRLGMPGARAGQQQPGKLPRSRLRPPSPPALPQAQVAAVPQAPAPTAEPAGAGAMDLDAQPSRAAAQVSEQQQLVEQQQQQQQEEQLKHKQRQQQQEQQQEGRQQQQQQQEQKPQQHVAVSQQPNAAPVAAPCAVEDLPAVAPATAAAGAAADAKHESPAAEDVVKPASPASETSHQQHIAAAAPQHLQALAADEPQQKAAPLPVGELLQQKQPEQTAVSRDRSQCSLPRGTDAVRGPAAVSMPAPAAVPAALLAPTAAAAGSAGAGRLLELSQDAMTPAARALAWLTAVPEVRQRCMPPEDRPVRTQDEALSYLTSVMEKAKQLKHQGDKRHNMLGSWDVFGLSHYALSTVEFLLYWDTAIRLLNKLRAGSQPVEKLQQQINNLSSAQFLRQTGALSTMAMNICSNCKGPDVAKQALRMLLERLSAISNMRNLHNQRKQLEGHIRLLKTNGASIGLGNGSSSNGAAMRAQQQQGQQQQQARLPMQAQQRVAAAAAATGAVGSNSGKPPSPSGSSWSPAGQQQFNKRSPDDSNASNQDRLQLPEGPGALPAAGGAAGVAASAGGGQGGYGQGERALLLAKSERQLMDSMQELLRMTDGMHQTVMRMQQFLESPDVLGSEHARAAALHISVLGLDAGMFSIPRVAAHTEAAVMCITKLLRSS